MRERLRTRLRDDQRGFTLVELITAISIGMIVLMAAFMVLDRTISASGQIADRSEALQRGRQAMSTMTRELRSAVCVGTTFPIVAGNDTSVTFTADLTDGTSVANPIKKRQLSWSGTTNTITETVTPSAGTYPNLTFTGTATSAPLLTNVQQILDPPSNTPRAIFRYYGYQTGTTDGTLVQLSSPLPATDLGRVALIKVGFRSFAVRPIANDKNSTVLEDDVYTRTAVPTQLQGAPECI
jgi:prepilin-type N-terminal cleavage/methylation domain-containing protein